MACAWREKLIVELRPCAVGVLRDLPINVLQEVQGGTATYPGEPRPVRALQVLEFRDPQPLPEPEPLAP